MAYKTKSEARYAPGDIVVHYADNSKKRHLFKIKIISIEEFNYNAIILDNMSNRLLLTESRFAISTVDKLFSIATNYNKLWLSLNAV